MVATVNATGPDPEAGGFSFPMEFAPALGGWQLSRQTADMLLVFGDSPVSRCPPLRRHRHTADAHRRTTPTPTR